MLDDLGREVACTHRMTIATVHWLQKALAQPVGENKQGLDPPYLVPIPTSELLKPERHRHAGHGGESV
jgi:hypothetical protein